MRLCGTHTPPNTGGRIRGFGLLRVCVSEKERERKRATDKERQRQQDCNGNRAVNPGEGGRRILGMLVQGIQGCTGSWVSGFGFRVSGFGFRRYAFAG